MITILDYMLVLQQSSHNVEIRFMFLLSMRNRGFVFVCLHLLHLFLTESFGQLIYNSNINDSFKILDIFLECVVKCNLPIQRNEKKNKCKHYLSTNVITML
jgi:hypothetical protein